MVRATAIAPEPIASFRAEVARAVSPQAREQAAREFEG